jgi:hypothetical protein
MKNLQKIASYILETVILLLVFQFSLLAAGEPAKNNASSLTAFQVIGGLAILLIFVLVPLMGGAGKHITVDKK